MVQVKFQEPFDAWQATNSLVCNTSQTLKKLLFIQNYNFFALLQTLLLLIQLTKGNANIQKIVAFENAFDRLFEVINEEGFADGGIVVEDCLLFMLNLLRNNASNQNFFKEGQSFSQCNKSSYSIVKQKKLLSEAFDYVLGRLKKCHSDLCLLWQVRS